MNTNIYVWQWSSRWRFQGYSPRGGSCQATRSLRRMRTVLILSRTPEPSWTGWTTCIGMCGSSAPIYFPRNSAGTFQRNLRSDAWPPAFFRSIFICCICQNTRPKPISVSSPSSPCSINRCSGFYLRSLWVWFLPISWGLLTWPCVWVSQEGALGSTWNPLCRSGWDLWTGWRWCWWWGGLAPCSRAWCWCFPIFSQS